MAGRALPARPVWVAVVLASLAGLLLRIAAARGDLWLDEIWSLQLVGRLHSAAAVFWDIPVDNNHFLNSLWLYRLGPSAGPLACRALSVLFGVLSIPAASWAAWCWGRGRWAGEAAVAAALLAAANALLVDYGSEARGYAGMILASFVAIAAFERALEPSARGLQRWRWILGLAIGLGALSHLAMGMALPVLVLVAFLMLREGRPLRAAVDATLHMAMPSVLLLLPAVAAMMAGIILHGGFTIGDVTPPSLHAALIGYLLLIQSVAGLPVYFWPVVLGVPCVLAVLLWAARAIGRAESLLAWIALIGLPGAMMALRLPNLQFPRYFLFPGVVAMLLEAAAIGMLWHGRRRGAAGVLLILSLLGQAAPDGRLLRDGRGGYTAAARIIAASGDTSYTSFNRFMAETVLNHAGRRIGAQFIYVAPDQVCQARPGWYIDFSTKVSTIGGAVPAPPRTIRLGAEGCPVYRERAVFPAFELSGMRWILYRRS